MRFGDKVMKLEKFLLGIIVMSLFCTVMMSAAAKETIRDGQHDVITVNFLTEETEVITSHPDIDVDNLDIEMATYDQTGKDATLTFTVYGNIENRGDIENANYNWANNPDIASFNIDMVEYGIQLTTSGDMYTLTYVNNKCQIIYSDETTLNLTDNDFSVNGGTLTIYMQLLNSSETYDSLQVSTSFTKMNTSSFMTGDFESVVMLSDLAPNPELEAYADVTNLAAAGKAIKFNGSAIPMTGQPPYTYQWNFGDGEESTEKDPMHTYAEPGSYNYTFTVTDSSDPPATASQSDTITITGKKDEGGSNTLLIFVIVIIIIALVGIGILVYILRR
jgi:PKD repeat protein